MINKNSFFRAYYFSRQAHGKGLRAGGEPKVAHPYRVAKRTEALFPEDEPLVMAAMLHDVLDDTDVDADWLHDEFGYVVTKGVKVLSLTPKVDCVDPEIRFLVDLASVAHVQDRLESVLLIDRLDTLQSAEIFSRTYLHQYYKECNHMLVMLKRADTDLREELFETLNAINDIYKLK